MRRALPPAHLRRPVLAAFAAGLLLSGLLLFQGGPLDQAVRTLAGEEARVVVRVENVGTRDAAMQMEVSKLGAERIFSTQALVAAGQSWERRLEGRLHGDFLAHARFAWTEDGRRGSGDLMQQFTGAECPRGETIVVTFVVDTTNGISFPHGDDVRCR